MAEENITPPQPPKTQPEPAPQPVFTPSEVRREKSDTIPIQTK